MGHHCGDYHTMVSDAGSTRGAALAAWYRSSTHIQIHNQTASFAASGFPCKECCRRVKPGLDSPRLDAIIWMARQGVTWCHQIYSDTFEIDDSSPNSECSRSSSDVFFVRFSSEPLGCRGFSF